MKRSVRIIVSILLMGFLIHVPNFVTNVPDFVTLDVPSRAHAWLEHSRAEHVAGYTEQKILEEYGNWEVVKQYPIVQDDGVLCRIIIIWEGTETGRLATAIFELESNSLGDTLSMTYTRLIKFVIYNPSEDQYYILLEN